MQKPGRREEIDNALYRRPMVLCAPRFGLPGHIVAAHGQQEKLNTTRFYTGFGAGEVVGQDGFKW